MIVKVGTFNLNNLFSRFNFASAIDEIKSAEDSEEGSEDVSISYTFTDLDNVQIRTFMGRLIKAKDADDTAEITGRIITMDVDVLAVQEVENIGILKEFNNTHLNGLYPYQALIEGNDNRFIDVGILSKLPLGAITSFQKAIHENNPGKTVFSRDLVQIDIMNEIRSQKLFTLFNTHLKSHYGDDDDNGLGKIDNDTRREQQAEKIAKIIAERTRPNSKYILTGDMNDPPDAAPLQPMLTIEGNQLFNALTSPEETRPPKAESSGHNPTSTAWTHRFKKSGQPPRHDLFDHIWLSPALESSFQRAFIDRRTKHGGDGSDHDPAWIELDV